MARIHVCHYYQTQLLNMLKQINKQWLNKLRTIWCTLSLKASFYHVIEKNICRQRRGMTQHQDTFNRVRLVLMWVLCSSDHHHSNFPIAHSTNETDSSFSSCVCVCVVPSYLKQHFPYIFHHRFVSSITYTCYIFPVQSIDTAGETEGWSEADVCPCAVGANPVNIEQELSTN